MQKPVKGESGQQDKGERPGACRGSAGRVLWLVSTTKEIDVAYDKVRAFLDTYRVWEGKDADLEVELREVLDNAEIGDNEAQVAEDLVREHIPEPLMGKDGDSLNAIERVLRYYGTVAKTLKDQFDLDLTQEDGLATLVDQLKQRDALDVLRSRVVGVVKQAGALDMKAQPDDNRLVILLTTLMP